MLVAEIIVVLAVFPLAGVITALQEIVYTAYGAGGRPQIEIIPAGHPAVSLFLSLAMAITDFVPFFLLWYLLRRSRERLSDIGIDRRHPVSDIASTVGLLGVLWVGSTVGAAVTGILPGVIDAPTGTNLPRYFMILGAVNSISAGLVEESVVLGYLWRRLEQLGLATGWIFLISVAVRLSYHTYYGAGVVELVPLALAISTFYMLRRRLLPCILAHSLFDTVLYAMDIL
jgi:membrane protease YdiL (CAAX protease family)